MFNSSSQKGPKEQEYDALGFPRYYKILNIWYDLENQNDVANLPTNRICGEINQKDYCMDEILIKKAEQHFTQYETDLRNAYMHKAMQIIDSGNGQTNKTYIDNYKNYDNSLRILYFFNGKLVYISPAMKDDINYYYSNFYNSDGNFYDVSTIKDITALPIPDYRLIKDSLPSPTLYIEYILQRKAMGYSDIINSKLCIAAFKKSNEMMISSKITYTQKDYMNYINYLLKCGLFEKAENEKHKLKDMLPHIFSQETMTKHSFKKTLQSCKELKTDLVEASYHFGCSSYDAKYRGRIFSISGKDKRFPLLTEDVLSCNLSFHPFIYGLTVPLYCEKGKEIRYSNRPFIDDRNLVEISAYNEYINKIKENEQKEIDRIEYYKLLHALPDLVPKSFGSYRRIKNSKSTTFVQIINRAKEIGISIR